MKRKNCTCAEVAFQAMVPDEHNCEYIRLRNELIPAAEESALALSTDESGEVNPNAFTYQFSNIMDRMAFEAGIL